jgi:hypothetical protein
MAYSHASLTKRRLAVAQGRHWYIGMAGIMVVIPILFRIMQCIANTWVVCVLTIIQMGKVMFYYSFGSKYFQKKLIITDNEWVNNFTLKTARPFRKAE